MPTTKATKSTTKATKATRNRARPRSRKNGGVVARADAARGKKMAGYILPAAAAVLGTGALATTGFLMREQLAELLHGAVETLTRTQRVSVAKLMALAGLERKRSFLSTAIPEVGSFALGIAAGAALTFWLAPKLRSSREAEIAQPSGEGEAMEMERDTAAEREQRVAPMPSIHVSS